MNHCIILWSFVNLVDGEAQWFFSVLAILAIGSIAAYFLSFFSNKFRDRFIHFNEPWKEIAVEALDQPLHWLIWILTVACALDIVLDRLFLEFFMEEFSLFIKAVVVLSIGWFLLRFKKRSIALLIKKSATHATSLNRGQILALSKLTTLFIALVIILLIMDVLEVNIRAIIAFGGISGIALAFASQEVISNFFSGIMIHVNQPFVAGDFIQLPASNIQGKVQDVGWYQTSLLTIEQLTLYIPNSTFAKASIINVSKRSKRMFNELFSLRHEDVPVVSQIVEQLRVLLQSIPSIDTSIPIIVNVVSVGLNSVDIRMSAAIQVLDDFSYFQLRDEVIMKVLGIIQQAGARLARTTVSIEE